MYKRISLPYCIHACFHFGQQTADFSAHCQEQSRAMPPRTRSASRSPHRHQEQQGTKVRTPHTPETPTNEQRHLWQQFQNIVNRPTEHDHRNYPSQHYWDWYGDRYWTRHHDAQHQQWWTVDFQEVDPSLEHTVWQPDIMVASNGKLVLRTWRCAWAHEQAPPPPPPPAVQPLPPQPAYTDARPSQPSRRYAPMPTMAEQGVLPVGADPAMHSSYSSTDIVSAPY